MATYCGGIDEVHLRNGLAVLEAVGQDAQRKRTGPGQGIVTGLSMTMWHFDT